MGILVKKYYRQFWISVLLLSEWNKIQFFLKKPLILTLCKFHFFRICSPPLRITKDVERNQRSLDVIMEKLWQKLNKKWHKEIKDKKWKFRWFFHVFFVETKFRRILLQYGKKSVFLIFLHDIKKLWLFDSPELIIKSYVGLPTFDEKKLVRVFSYLRKNTQKNFSLQKLSGENSHNKITILEE